jgi:hypothetical protein
MAFLRELPVTCQPIPEFCFGDVVEFLARHVGLVEWNHGSKKR